MHFESRPQIRWREGTGDPLCTGAFTPDMVRVIGFEQWDTCYKALISAPWRLQAWVALLPDDMYRILEIFNEQTTWGK